MPKDERPPERDRESIWSVAKGWLPWYLLLTFSLLAVWSAFVVWNEITYGDYPAPTLLGQASVIKISGGVIAIVIFCLAAVTAADTGGGAFMVTYRYLNNKFVEPLRRQLRQEGREQGLEQGIEQGLEQGIEQGREEGIAQGIAQGREQGRQEGIAQGREQFQEFKMRTMEWYARQQQALAKGEPFDEPPPFIGSANGKDPAGE